MKPFNGFPARMQFTAVPDLFFSELLPEIEDAAELKLTLYILHVVYGKRGYPRFASRSDLSGSASLMRSLRSAEGTAEEALDRALDMAVKRGTILELTVNKEGLKDTLYFINNEADRQAIEKIKGGELELKGLKVEQVATPVAEELPDIYTLYEENIGMLTPMIAEELKSAEKLYPKGWIAEATRQAVKLNKRKWSYIAAILERWAAEGKDDGTHLRDNQKTDPNKYIKGKYGHLVQR